MHGVHWEPLPDSVTERRQDDVPLRRQRADWTGQRPAGGSNCIQTGMDKGERGKNLRGPGLKVPVVELGTTFSVNSSQQPQLRLSADGRPSSASGLRSGWWTIEKSTGSPYRMDQRFPLRGFGSGRCRHSDGHLVTSQQQHKAQKSPGQAYGGSQVHAQSMSPHPAALSCGQSHSHSAASGIGTHLPGAGSRPERHAPPPAHRVKKKNEHRRSWQAEESPRNYLRDNEKRGSRRHDNDDDDSPVQRHDGDRASLLHRHSQDGKLFPRQRDGDEQDHVQFHSDANVLRRVSNDRNGFTRSHSFDVPISSRRQSKDSRSLSKRNDEQTVSAKTNDTNHSLYRSQTHDEIPGSCDDPGSAMPFYRAAIALMQKKAMAVPTSPAMSPRSVTLLDTLKQSYHHHHHHHHRHHREADERPPRHWPQQTMARPGKQQRYGNAHRPGARPPKSILRAPPAGREGRQLSASIQRGMSLYVEKLLLLTERASADAQSSSLTAPEYLRRTPAPSASVVLSPRPQKKVTFGADVIVELQPDVGMTGRTLSRLTES